VTENCLEIEDILKFESLEACKGKKAAFGWLAQALKNHRNSNFHIQESKMFVCLEI
jgi:hypothetical protein